MKIYDCFQFFNELDLLEIRLELLYNVVDKFVIVETNKTHSNKEKPLFFNENKKLFEKYSDKIIHVISDFPNDMKNVKNFYKNSQSEYDKKYNEILDIFDEKETILKKEENFARDYFQRDFIKLGLLNCDDDDIILVSDLDEIPKPEVIIKIKNENLLNHVVLMDCHNYFINNLSHTNWFGTFSIKYSDIKRMAFSRLREESSKTYTRINNGGWHLSFVGGPERVKTKIESYSHQEYNNTHILSSIEKNINDGRDLFGRGNYTYKNDLQEFFYEKNKYVSLDMYDYPEIIINLIKDKFPYLIKN